MKHDALRQPRRIFIKGLNWVGDAIISTPALARLRAAHPDAVITLMARPWVAAVYEHNPHIDELWVHDDSASAASFAKAVRMVRRGRFDVGIALPNSIRSGLLLWLGGVRWRIGFGDGARASLLNVRIARDSKLARLHQVYSYLRLVEGLCPPVKEPARQVLVPGELEREEVRLLLRRLGLDRGQELVGLAPGSINSDAKRWPAERFAALADRLARERRCEILLLGGAPEKAVLDRVAAAAATPVHNLGGALGLGGAIALAERLSALICNDSGAMHIGAALGIPTIAIFGPTEWETTYPFSSHAKIVRREGIECAPCMLRDCPIDHRCMTAIEVDEVIATMNDLFTEMHKEKAGAK